MEFSPEFQSLVLDNLQIGVTIGSTFEMNCVSRIFDSGIVAWRRVQFHSVNKHYFICLKMNRLLLVLVLCIFSASLFVKCTLTFKFLS